ncbi:MAG: hypothetical protein Q8L26_06615 [Candidatus Omnitrophota bacterium]|nr:hypothetical protein [Candidatus Omnitrophota bacterium]
MKRITLTGVLLVTILIISSGLVYAGDSQTIGISCTIPLIPGVNAPLNTTEVPAIVEEDISFQAEAAAVETANEGKQLQIVEKQKGSDNLELYTYYQK